MEHEMVARWEAALAETLRAERAAAKLTQVELAAKAGIPRVTYNRYETGERRPNVVQVAQIADGLGMKLSMWGGRDAAVWPILPIGLGVGIILYAVSKLGDE